MKGVEYKGCNSVDGPIIVVRRSENIFYGEIAAVRDRFGAKKIGRVIDISEEYAIVQIFGTTTGLDLDETTLEFLETPMELRVGEGLLGRIFNGLGQPIDGYKDIISSKKVNVNGYPINPYARVYPRDFKGQLRPGVYAKDVILAIIKNLTVNGATDKVIVRLRRKRMPDERRRDRYPHQRTRDMRLQYKPLPCEKEQRSSRYGGYELP